MKIKRKMEIKTRKISQFWIVTVELQRLVTKDVRKNTALINKVIKVRKTFLILWHACSKEENQLISSYLMNNTAYLILRLIDFLN